jgi:MFS family permease
MGEVGGISLPLLITLFVILGIFSSLTTPPSMALVGDIVDPENIAIGMGFFNFLGNFGIFIGPIIAGLLKFNYSFAFVVAGLIELISLAVAVVFIWYFKKKV